MRNHLWKSFVNEVLNTSCEYIFNKFFFFFFPEPVIEKPEQYVEIASLFLNQKFNSIKIPKDM